MTEQRKYSLSEIVRMRETVRRLVTPIDQGYHQKDVDARTEDQLRAYMLAGISPEELEAALRWAHFKKSWRKSFSPT